MEFNLSSREKTHQIVQSSDDVSGHVRSYTCTFCKRGFSNAQALGGHMNIHRKDRAKLKEFPETLVSPSDDSSSQVESSEEKSGSLKTTWVFSKDDDYHQHEVSRGKDGGVGEVKQLCLFADHKQISSRNYEEIKSKGLSPGSSSHEEVDLELRLGLEHHER